MHFTSITQSTFKQFTKDDAEIHSNYNESYTRKASLSMMKLSLIGFIISIIFIWMIYHILHLRSSINQMQMTINALDFSIKDTKAQLRDLTTKKKELDEAYSDQDSWNQNLRDSIKTLLLDNANLVYINNFQEVDIEARSDRLNQKTKDKNDLIELMTDINELIAKISIYKANMIELASIKTKNDRPPIDSEIITSMDDYKILTDWLNYRRGESIEYTLLYRMTIDSFEAESFHHKCDYVSDTVVILRTAQGMILGGYTNAKWDALKTDYSSDRSAFLFNLSYNKRFPIQDAFRAIYNHNKFLAVFGQGDLTIRRNEVSTMFPQSYGPGSRHYELTNGDQLLNINEMEVFHVVYSLI